MHANHCMRAAYVAHSSFDARGALDAHSAPRRAGARPRECSPSSLLSLPLLWIGRTRWPIQQPTPGACRRTGLPITTAMFVNKLGLEQFPSVTSSSRNAFPIFPVPPGKMKIADYRLSLPLIWCQILPGPRATMPPLRPIGPICMRQRISRLSTPM